MLVGPEQPRITDDVNVKRLSWAGVQLEAGGSSVVIDLFAEAEPVKPVMGEPAHLLVRVDDNSVQLALVTHVHANHYDPDGVSGGSRRTGSSGVALGKPGEVFDSAAA
jgi:L-ascorbate metabolism protein UlaG (beta-lactamase superfamily)